MYEFNDKINITNKINENIKDFKLNILLKFLYLNKNNNTIIDINKLIKADLSPAIITANTNDNK